jgi:CRISPR system Cascade subunit CasE
MHAFQPDVGLLVRLAAREGLLPPGDDLGYALHVVLAATFPGAAPKPFCWCPPGTASGAVTGRLLCYSSASLDTLREHATNSAGQAFASVLDVSAAASKEMPTMFSPGKRLDFRVRVRPVLRTGKSRDGSGGKERDAFPSSPDDVGRMTSRGECYLAWLTERFSAGGVHLEQGRLESFRLTRLMTRDRSGEKSRRDAPTGPDAVAVGTLVVSDSEAFAGLLARGIGRFRAFGFGMLLVAPAGRGAS